MNRAELEALIERVEKATGPDWDIEAEITALCRIHPYGPDHWLNRSPEFEFRPTHQGWVAIFAPNEDLPRDAWRSPEFTSSLDAIVGLIERELPEAFYHVAKGQLTDNEPLFGAVILFGSEEEMGHGESWATPALAMCAAFLRARLAEATR